MLPGMLGKKVGMTHVFSEDGKMTPVTVVQAGPLFVTQVKSKETDGYNAVQVGFGERSEKSLTFPKHGHFKKAGVNRNLETLREFKVDDTSDFEPGQEIRVDVFEEGDRVTVTGTSKGHGFAGVVKRYGFKGQQMTHGFMTHRRPLSNGATGPQRVFPGKRGPGQMGSKQITQKGVKVVKVDLERNLVLLKGSVPGAPGKLIQITKVKR